MWGSTLQTYKHFAFFIALLPREVDCASFLVVLIFFSLLYFGSEFFFLRRGVVRAATIEEIEAEKTLIEKDVVSSYVH